MSMWITLVLYTFHLTVCFAVKDVCQGTSNGLEGVADTAQNRITTLSSRYKDCQYVDGNLEIVGLDQHDFYYRDLSFLNNIREVTGYVLIANVYVQNVTLENLRIIRGDSLYHPPSNQNTSTSSVPFTARSNTGTLDGTTGYALYVSHNFMSPSIGMRLLGLRKLTEISAGGVLFENNNLLCYATNDIYWPDILANRQQQSVKFTKDHVADVKPCNPGCHEDCAVAKLENRRYCWGPGPKSCQKMNKVICAEQCGDERCFGTEPTMCCHAECAGGCAGPSKTDCYGCKNFYNDGGCESFCPPQMIYDNTNFRWVENPHRKLAYGKLCTEKCPLAFLEHKGGCVRSCPEDFESSADEKRCVACSGPCAKKCVIEWPSNADYINSKNIQELEGCTSVNGHLIITDATFKGDSVHDIPPMSVDRLSVLASIKDITGYLLVQGVTNPNFTNLEFLSNLHRILGREGDRYNAALNVRSNSYLEYLGLTSLRSIPAAHALVIVTNNPRLCYVASLKWRKIRHGSTVMPNYLSGNANEIQYCKARKLVCDPECKNGCWGPGNTRCLACRHFKYNDQCLKDCSGTLLFNVQGERECQDCHPQCKSACNGTTAENCDECKNYRDGPYCVSLCPEEIKYPDANRTCQPCHSNCIKGCTGPGNFIGEGGCNSCEVSVANEDETAITRCLQKGEMCPLGYFANINAQGNLSFLKDLVVCTKCHPLCAECEEGGNFHCTKCTHYKRDDVCVEKCASDYYPDELSKQCYRCHDTCRRDCYGPTQWDCVNCAHYKVYNDSRVGYSSDVTSYSPTHPSPYTTIKSGTALYPNNISSYSMLQTTESQLKLRKQFYCLETKECPAEKPATIEEKMDTVCVLASQTGSRTGDKERQLPVEAIVGGAAGGLIILLIIVIVVWQCSTKASQRRKWTQMTPDTTRLEPVDPSTAPPDMSKLRLIKEVELRRGGILGSGAFGTVYKGVWLPQGENLKIPVAIKVLQEGNSSHQNQELLEEARVMASVEHPCCVRIVAVCMTEQMMLVTQLMPLGCLLDYVKTYKDRISSKVMLNWCTQIAKGMMYLESKGVVHRDLAARNVLVRSPNQVKITDFGLAKLLDCNEGEYHSAGGKMPIKWLALESIQHRKFTHKTDVWSYGVTLWEMFTYGQKPYENNRAFEVPELLEEGERLPQPTICTIDVYMIMIKCWVIDADSRPSFSELSDEFAKMCREPSRYLIIKGDSQMRLPPTSIDAREMMMSQSSDLLSEDGPEQMMDADDYLHTFGGRSVSSAFTDVTYANIDEEPTTPSHLGARHPHHFPYNHRIGSLPSRHADSRTGQSANSLHMTYPRHNGATYVNDFLSRESTPGGDSSYGHGSSSTLDRVREVSPSDLSSNGAIHSTSINSLKPLRASDSLLCIEEMSQDDLQPPNYFELPSTAQLNHPSANGHAAAVLQHAPTPVYEDDYLKPRSQSTYSSSPPDHDAPPTPARTDKKDKVPVFSFNMADGGNRQQQQSKQRVFANPEYYSEGDMGCPMPSEDVNHLTNDDEEFGVNDINNPLLPSSSTTDYYNSMAAFGSDSSARDSFVST